MSVLGWLLLLGIFYVVSALIISYVHQYLAISDPAASRVVIIEGWLPDAAMQQVADRVKQDGYDLVITSGGELVRGGFISEFRSYADLSAATLTRLGIDPKVIVPVSSQSSGTDRTIASALAVKHWLSERKILLNSINIYTLGVHARRTRLVFDTVLDGQVNTGIISIPDNAYDPDSWWESSAGVKTVIGEMISLIYTKLTL